MIVRNAPTRIVPSEKEPKVKFSLNARIIAVSLSLKKDVKTNIHQGSLIENYGLENDENAGCPIAF